ncbi:MAG: ATPase [Microbacterium sp. 71-36]|uniref:GIY-YIG nuclease family protein n=1 Tax=unclassified Microbacterium TaxID=2609290 RepID=UPI000868EB46|nr:MULTISPECIES: GIY-YIG nuclease family protein [unclassified Microbacterium]MBN9212965.1 GIY-YIG nuclease family protein [Microbacterium sp.]ODT36663.1 MAG: ATPase [Microbacterium sp. SCN 71-17]ODU52680.1 MAG: ATPase [Microbacterium sp. SCN 70-10]OJV76783.1 MAG: ATPase [Microbacterium sp. 71-36]
MSERAPCLVPACGAVAAPDAPLRMCEEHLMVAAEWVGRRDGVADVLPTPCLLCGSRWGVRWPSGWLCGVCEWRHGEPVDGELPPPRVDVVYYLRFRDRVKIGTSAQPRQRLRAIRHEELLAFERGDRSVERRRHAQFAAERLGGSEWFALSEALGTHIDSLSAGVDDPWNLFARWTSEAFARRG